LDYFRYVDDILVVYNTEITDMQDVLDHFSMITPTIQFTIEEEQDSKINFLDIHISKTNKNTSFDIFRKPTATDTIIPKGSCHPAEHKLGAIRYLQNRNATYLVTPESRLKETKTIDHILQANKYEPTNINTRTKTKKAYEQSDSHDKKWAKITYLGKEVRMITKLFKRTNLNIVFSTKHNTGKLLSQKQHVHRNNVCDRSRVYQLTSSDCKMKYIGQRGRPFHVRFKQHVQDFRLSNNKSNFAQHLLEQQHSLGTIEETMDIVHTTSKGRLLNVIEKFYIYKETKNNNQINDRHTVAPNIIFDMLLRMNNTHKATQP
jgi:hypothetical protein